MFILIVIAFCRYSFAIVGINLTQLVYTLFKDGDLKNHFYNIAVKEMTPTNRKGMLAIKFSIVIFR